MAGAVRGPWESDVSVARMEDLAGLWERWTQPDVVSRVIDWYKSTHDVDVTVAEVRSALGSSLNDRKIVLSTPSDLSPAPDPNRKQTTAERVDAAIIEHFAATDAYATAVEESARRDAEAKRIAARKFLAVKADIPEGQKRVTDSEANRAVDADQEVLDARLSADIALAHAKAAKARLDHWEHVIEWGRSVYSRETRADTR